MKKDKIVYIKRSRPKKLDIKSDIELELLSSALKEYVYSKINFIALSIYNMGDNDDGIRNNTISIFASNELLKRNIGILTRDCLLKLFEVDVMKYLGSYEFFYKLDNFIEEFTKEALPNLNNLRNDFIKKEIKS